MHISVYFIMCVYVYVYICNYIMHVYICTDRKVPHIYMCSYTGRMLLTCHIVPVLSLSLSLPPSLSVSMCIYINVHIHIHNYVSNTRLFVFVCWL